MRILHIVWSFKLGGIETMLINIANLQVKKHEVAIMIINDVISDTLVKKLSPNIKLITIKRKPKSKSLVKLLKINTSLLVFKPDIIHFHQSNAIGIILLPWYRKRCCCTQHNSLTNEKNSDFKKYRTVFAISHSVEAQLQERGINAVCVNNGIEIQDFDQRGSNRLPVCLHIVQISRLYCKQKGQDLLLKAIARLKENYKTNIRLDLIGEGSDEKYLKDLAHELHIDSNVNFLGARSPEYIHTHLKDYDLFVQPSHYEGFGLTVIEAMAAKVPVLVSANEGPMEIIENGKYGFSFCNNSVEDCSKHLYDITQMNDLHDIASKAFNHIYQNYSIEKTVAKYISLYKEIIHK